MNVKKTKMHFLPFILTLIVIGSDQISKALIVRSITPWSVGYEFLNGFLRIVCVYNTGAAFSLGHGLSEVMRLVMLGVLPSAFILAICVVYFTSSFTVAQRWFLCGIIGGGISNLLDRFFRVQGVVDFIDVKFFGIFGMERWPTFNIADSVIVVCAAGLFVTIVMQELQTRRNAPNVQTED